MRQLFFLCLIFISCGRHSSLPSNQLRLSFMADPISLDPRKGGDFISATLHCMIYEGLTRCLPDGSLEWALAERVEVLEGETVYVFHLRKAVWSNGDPVTAYDFERAWKSVLDPAFPSLCSYLLFPIKNGQAYAKGEVASSAVGIEAIDARTLRVSLERPTPHFLSLTAFPLLLPVHGDAFNGPFQIEKIVPQQEIVLKKNLRYWRREGVSLDSIHISILPHETTAWQLFERGELDWIGGAMAPLPPDVLESVQSKLQFHPVAATTFCAFNTRSFPFQNGNLRKAFSYAIQREQIVQVGQIPATRGLPPTLSRGGGTCATDLKRAKELFGQALEELGIEASALDGITLYFKGGQVDKRLAQMLQKQWKEVLGVTVALQEVDFKSHMDRLHTHNYQLSIASWIAQIHDPINILERFAEAKNPKNFPAWEDREYQSLIQEIQRAKGEERDRWIQAAETRLIDAAPIAPLYHWSNPSLCNPELEGLATTPSGGILFDRCKKKVNIP